MPFGLCNALATFTRMLNEVFRPIYARYPGLFRHYMDDVIIMTPLDQKDLHMEIAHMFFDILEKNLLYLKPAKCEFFQTEVDYLGIHIKNGELMIDLAKIAGIKDWPTMLKNIKEVRSTRGARCTRTLQSRRFHLYRSVPVPFQNFFNSLDRW